MRKKLCGLLLLALLGTTACSGEMSAGPAQSEEPAESGGEEFAEAASEGKILDGRWLNPDIIGNVTKDTPAELKDNFALYVNKDWILNTTPSDMVASLTPLSEAALIVSDRQMKMLTDDSLTGHDAELVHKLYALVTDWDYRDAQGISPAVPYMDAIRDIDSLDELYNYLCSEDNLMQLYPFTVNVDSDPVDSLVYIAYIDPPSLTLGIEEEYRNRTDAGDLFYNEAKQVAEYMLVRLGYSEEEASKMFENSIAYETLLAEAIPSDKHERGKNSDSGDCYTYGEFTEMAEGIPVDKMLEAQGFTGGDTICITVPEYFSALKDIYTEENVPLIKDWLAVKTASELNDLLDKETSRAVAKLYGAMSGLDAEANDDFIALATINGYLPIPMDNLYVRQYCNEQQREDITGIVEEFKKYYREMLENDVDWLSEETRKAAIEKLDNMRVNVVYPDELEDWSGLDFAGPDEGGSLLEAVKAITRFKTGLKASLLGTKANVYKWNQYELQASSVNATYTGYNNSINIQAGILVGEIYNEDMSFEQKMGGIGMIIGHEISHAFDSNGAEYDKDGHKNNWWTDEDYAAFRDRVAKLVTWYDGFVPMEGIKYSGDRVKTEAIADMTSMKCLLYIAKQTEGFDYDTFFRQYAKLWRDQSTPEAVKDQILTDVHPAHYLRINATLAQFDDFLSFYGITEGDGMYIAPEDRVAVW
ncbi:M13 family metallopeptidase [Butyrivibrio sp. AC2005]|uniref:M13 family metallopeptidase n=1 Tax=Butyrivibrio sp. AC2005 TaxID=1280672 RepID=UPI0004235C7F|nr:M13 family metallopeptidase [Butyrivibrio sp. AC2005]